MHDAARVRRVERVGDLRRGCRAPSTTSSGPSVERLAQRLAVDEIHHEVEPAVVEPAEREHVDHVRVIDLVDRARLANEALRRFLADGELALEDLDRDALADHRVDCRVDLAHRARAEEPLDHVVADGVPLDQPIRQHLADRILRARDVPGPASDRARGGCPPCALIVAARTRHFSVGFAPLRTAATRSKDPAASGFTRAHPVCSDACDRRWRPSCAPRRRLQ